MAFKGDGIYHIKHAHVGIRMALGPNSSKDGAPVIAWHASDDLLDHLWLIKSVPDETGIYTIQNTVGGTYMSLIDGTPVLSARKTNPGLNQYWIIKPVSKTKYWRIQNKANEMFMDLDYGGNSNGTKIQGWHGSWDEGRTGFNRDWTFQCQSILGHEIRKLVNATPYLGHDNRSFIDNGMYLTLDRERLQAIWRNSGLISRKWRSAIFDADDFAYTYKAEVAKWGDEQFRADGFAIICGIMFGSISKNAFAYNWMINPEDKASVIFFDPQNNSFTDTSSHFSVF
ncbi:hypothetical protein C8Q70DRAFT_1049592 [Cubamyces menziesii]|nr:hypothetical protein C8Q70DRAFT_1049592 [Cubamyces menziesii]